jgi:uncharacterized membrane protein
MPDATLPGARPKLIGAAHVVFVLLLAAMLGQLAWYYPELPERMASHFTASGQANAFMPKADFVKLHLVIVGLLVVLFLLVPMLITRLPPSMINLPNKDYWLAPERRASTGRTLQGFLVGYGNVMLLFLLVVFGEAMRASLTAVPQLSNRVWFMMVVLGGFTIYWTARFMLAFRRPRSDG